MNVKVVFKVCISAVSMAIRRDALEQLYIMKFKNGKKV